MTSPVSSRWRRLWRHLFTPNEERDIALYLALRREEDMWRREQEAKEAGRG